MSSIYLIDYYSNTIKSALHKRSAVSKLVFLFLILFSIIFSKSIFNLLFIFLFVVSLITVAKLPLFKILKWSLYPAFFASLFAISQIQYGWLPLQTMLRAIDAALLVLLVVCTTPYPAIFSPFNKFSPILGNMFFLTYRYFFMAMDKIQTKIKLTKIRGGYAGGPARTLKNTGSAIGWLFVHLIEKSGELYKLLIIRGYQGIIFSKTHHGFRLSDIILIVLGAAVLAAAIINPYAI